MQTEKPHLAFELAQKTEIENAKKHINDAILAGKRPSMLSLTDEEYKEVLAMDETQRGLFVEKKLQQMSNENTLEAELKVMQDAQEAQEAGPRNREERRHGRD